MGSVLTEIVVDAADPARLAGFWVVLADPEGNEFCLLRPRVG